MKLYGTKISPKFPTFNISENISNYSKQMFEYEVQHIKYLLKNLYTEHNIGKSDIDKTLLQQIGVMKIGSTSSEGIQIAGRRSDIIVSSPDKETLSLILKNKLCGEPEEIYTLTTSGKYFNQRQVNSSRDYEHILETSLDEVNTALFNLKRSLTGKPVRPYIPTSAEQQNLQQVCASISIPKAAAKLDDRETALLNEIKKRFTNIKTLFQKFNNDRTRSNVRYYYDKYDSEISNKSTMAFKALRENERPVSVSFIQYKGKPYCVIKSQNEKLQEVSFVINERGMVQRNMPFEKHQYTKISKKRAENIPQYYTPRELEELGFKNYLTLAIKELEGFEQHTINHQKKQAGFLVAHTNTDIGSTASHTNTINEITKGIESIKAELTKNFKYLCNGQTYLKSNGFDIDFSRRGIMLRHITPENNDLRLTFPATKGKRAVQLLVMQDNIIKESYYIQDEKLVRYEIKNIRDAFTHADRNIYYHTQEYIDSSRLGEYLNIIKKSVKEIKAFQNNFNR